MGEQKGGGGGGEGDGGEGLVGQAAICVATPANSMLRPESTLLTVKVSCAQRRRGSGSVGALLARDGRGGAPSAAHG